MEYILYHQVKKGVDCPDGVCAAWVSSKKFPNATIHGCVYQETPPIQPSKGDKVIIVDFSFPPQILEEWADKGVDVTVIDHHKTALENLSGLSDRILQSFDMNECGASLAWKVLFSGEKMPEFIEYVRSRDLWLDCNLFTDPLSETLIVHQMLSDYKKQFPPFQVFDFLQGWDKELIKQSVAYEIAKSSLEDKRNQIKEIANRTQALSLPGEDFWTYGIELKKDGSEDHLVSDLCTYLYTVKYPEVEFVFCITSDGSYSLRSNGKADVSEIAKKYGGGGHRGAAGFKVKQEVG